MSDVPFKPRGFASVTPYLTIKGVGQALQWYARAFGAEPGRCLKAPAGQVAYAEFSIGDSMVMACDEDPMFGTKGPSAYGGSPVTLHLYVADADGMIERAVAAGAVLQKPAETQFFGDRSGSIRDPYGYSWIISTHVEDIDPADIQKSWKEACASMMAG